MHSMGNLMLASTQVNHSQKMNEKPLTLWVIALKSGKILAAHCDSAAGIGETYSYVASLLWVIGGVESKNSLTVTQKSAYWVMPPAIWSIPYAPLKDTDFIGKKRKSCESGATSSSSTSKKQFPKRRRVNRCSFSIPWPHVQELSRSTGRCS